MEQGTLSLRGAEEPAVLAGPLTITGAGSVDEYTGAISGASFTAAKQSFDFPITSPLSATVYVDATFSEVVPGSVTGVVKKLDGGRGEVTMTATVKVDLHVEVSRPPIVSADCTASPIALPLRGIYDPATEKVTLDGNFSVPAVPITPACADIVASGVNERLAGGGHAISLQMGGDLFVPVVGTEATTTSLSVEPPTSGEGDEVVLTSTVAPVEAGPTPTGFVEFRDGAVALGSAALDGTGTATLATSELSVGVHQLSAFYLGDETYGPSQSAVVEHLVAASPTVAITMGSSVLIGGQPRPATVTVTNPEEFGADVENARLGITIGRTTGTGQLNPNRIKVDWRNGATWEPVPLVSMGTTAVTGVIGATTGFPLPAGTVHQVQLRISAFTVGTTPSPTLCLTAHPTCPGPVALTASLVEVDPETGGVVEPIGSAVHDFHLVETTRRATTFSFSTGAPRPHTVRQGYTVNVSGNISPIVAGLRPTGSAEFFLNGEQVAVRSVNAPLGSEYIEQVPVTNGSINGFILLPPDIDVGAHIVTVRYSGNPYFAPLDATTTLTVLPAHESVPGVADHPFVCAEEGFSTKVELGTNVEFDALLPATVASGVATGIDVSSAVLRMNRQHTSGLSAPFAAFVDGSTSAIGSSSLTGITFDLGDNGTGTAEAFERQGGSQIEPTPNPATGATVDQTITLHGPSASITIDGEPGEVVPVELEQITLGYILDEGFPVQYSMTCTPVGGAVRLGEVLIAGTTVTATPDPAREITDEVTLEASTYPADAAGTVSFSSDLDGALGSDAVAGGSAELATDELSPGVHTITASFDATDPDVPDTAGTTTVRVTYSPRTGTQAFVVAARTDYTGEAPEEDVLADAGAISAGKTRAAYLSELSRSDEYLAHVVNEMYLDTLGRPGDADGVEFWTGRLRAGWSVARVAANFYSSDEYYGRVGGTDAAWVGDLYEVLLGRAPDTAGQAFWTARIATHGRGQVALSFFQTPESARARVVALYQQFLGRNPEPAGRDFWAGRVIAQGDLVLAVHLTLSDEYAARAQTRFPLV